MRGEGWVASLLLATLWLLAAGCVKALPPTLIPDAQHAYQTQDGWENNLRRYPAEGAPVLLVHGMGTNHYNWDFRPEISLAHALQQEGFDVWVVELRGGPGSTPPSRRAKRSVTFDDYAEHDLPAAVEAVLAHTQREKLLWVGHSMGGMLLYAYLSERPEQIAAGVALCSPAAFLDPLPLHKTGRAFAWMAGGRGFIPAPTLARLSRPLGPANPLFRTVGNKENLDWATLLGLSKYALAPLPKPLMRQAARWIKAEALVDLRGEPWVHPRDTPLRVFGAPRDKIVSHLDVARACEVFTDCEYTLLSKDQGFSHDYGHIDPVLGISASTEVYPLVVDFLRAHEGSSAPPQAHPEPQG